MNLASSLLQHVDAYEASHRTPVNRALHFVGIPLLLISSLGLLAKLAFTNSDALLQPNAAWPVLLGTSSWYIWSDWRLGLLATVALTSSYALGNALPVGPLLMLTALGITAHAIGHYGFEHRPPAVFSRPLALLEAPIWLLATWTGRYR